MQVDLSRGVRTQTDKLPSIIQSKIKSELLKLETFDNTNEIKSEKLKGTKNYYKIRIGNYRIVYQKIAPNHIEVTSVRDRKDIYNKLFGLTFSL